MILAGSTGSGNFTMILILVVMIALMYFMMIRPQSKEKKRVEAMLASMDIGDAVLTSSGFYGVIIEITADDVIVEFGNNKNCRIPMKKSAIVQVEKPGGAAAPAPVSTKPKKEKAAAAVEEKAVEEVKAEKDEAAPAQGGEAEEKKDE